MQRDKKKLKFDQSSATDITAQESMLKETKLLGKAKNQMHISA